VGGGVVAVLAIGLTALALWPRHRSSFSEPFSASIDCARYDARTGRIPIRLTVTSRVSRPLRFQGHVVVAIRRIRPGGNAAHNWVRYAYVDAESPLTTIPAGETITWSTVKGPVLLRGSTAHLKLGGCTFYADPPRV
jgi:hypothetical protein